MQLQTEKRPGSQLEMTFALDESDVRRAYDKVFSELGDQPVPGFRPGHVPPAVIKRRVKPEMLRDMFWMKAVETFVEPELTKEDLNVIGDPEFPKFDELEVEDGQGVEFTLTVTVRPEPELPETKGLKLYRVTPEVTDEQVDQVLQQMREAEAKETPVTDRPVEKGDIVEANLKITLEGQDEPVHESSQSFEVGSGRYQPAIDEALVGHSLDETVTLDHEYPEDHEDEELAGQKATIAATIEEIRARELPEFTDEFAKSQGEYETVDDLRASVRERLEKEAEKRSREMLENDALAAVVKDTQIDLPERLVDDVARRGFEQFVQELQGYGMSPETFAEVAQADVSTLQQNERRRAEMALKVQFVSEALAKAQEIEVGDEDVQAEIGPFAEEARLETEFVERALDVQENLREQLEDRARRRLMIQKLLDDAEIEDVTRERYDEIREEERKAAQEKAEAEAKAAEEAAAAEAEAEAAEAEPGTTEAEAPAAEEAAAEEPAVPEAEDAAEAAPEATAETETEKPAEATE